MNPLLSIVTVCFNSEKTIGNTIRSVLNQSAKDFEYILIDGLSSDNTIEIIKSFDKEFQNRGIGYSYISERDTGIYDAFNKAIRMANGRWISFLGSDDCYLDNAIEIYSKAILNLEQPIDFIHSNVVINDKRRINVNWSWKKFKVRMHIAHVGSFHNMRYFAQYGLFDTDYKIVGDYELLLRAGNGLKTFWINTDTVTMGSEGISNKRIIEVYKETTRAKIKNNSRERWLIFMDYYLWVFKYFTKRVLNVFIR